LKGVILMLVPVQSNDGSPLSPCHPARARILLKQGKANVISMYPFMIRLTYRISTPSFAATRVSLDDGRTVGLAVVQETAVANVAVCRIEMKTRGEEISDNVKARKALRAQRRNRRNHKRGVIGDAKIDHRHGQEYPPGIRAVLGYFLWHYSSQIKWHWVWSVSQKVYYRLCRTLLIGPREGYSGLDGYRWFSF